MSCFLFVAFLFLLYVDARVICLHACHALLGSMCLCTSHHVSCLDRHLYMSIGLYPCSIMFTVMPCLFLHAYVHVFMLICLDLCFHMLVCLDLCSLHVLQACALHAMFVMPCAIVALLSLNLSSCVLAYWFGPDLDPMVFVIVCTPWPTSKVLDHPICLSMLTRFYALCLC